MKQATFVRALSASFGWSGDARLYKLSPPLSDYEYVVVSAVLVPFSGSETFIFGSNSRGEPLNWGELEGSFEGGLSHEKALKGAGYEVVEYT